MVETLRQSYRQTWALGPPLLSELIMCMSCYCQVNAQHELLVSEHPKALYTGVNPSSHVQGEL